MSALARRYSRHLALDGFTPESQGRLSASTVVVVGAGGLGSPVLQYLAGAGVGRIRVIDDDVVSEEDLHRQVLYGVADVGAPKVEAAAARLRAMNPGVEVEACRERLVAESTGRLLWGADLVVDCSDGFDTRYLVNDACAVLAIPLVAGAVDGYAGQVAVWWRGRGPCLRCLHPSAAEDGGADTCLPGGALGPVCAVVGGLTASEAIKILAGVGEPMLGAVALYDALSGTVRNVPVRARAGCAACGVGPRSSGGAPETEVCDPLPELSVEEVRAAVSRGEDLAFVDCREFPEGEGIPGAVRAPLGRWPSRRPPAAGRAVVYCEVGRSSLAVVTTLRESGHDAWSLRGGLTAWRAAGGGALGGSPLASGSADRLAR